MAYTRLKKLCLMLAFVLFSLAAMAEPSLPAGLENTDSKTEPALPAGMGEDDWGDEWADDSVETGSDWPAGDGAWEDTFDQEDRAKELPFSGFWEMRLGHRFSPAEYERGASLAESRLELEKDFHWQQGAAKLTGDFVYDDLEDSQSIDLETGEGWLDLREAWLEQRLGDSMDVKAGRQILTWGVGDLVFINDLFPKDWISFLAGRDEQYLKSPSDAIRYGWYGESLNLNLIYTPRFDSDRYIDGHRLFYFNPMMGEVVGRNAILETDRPDKTPDNDEWALRLYRSLGSYEIALYGYDGYWKSPAGFDPDTAKATFPRLSVLGISARGPLGPGILSLETGYYDSRDDGSGRDPLINNDEFRALAGYEWELMADTTLGLQYYLEALQNYNHYRQSLLPGQHPRDENRQLVTARLTRLAMNQNLTLSLFGYFSPTDSDSYVRSKASYKLTDNWMVEAGVNVFNGSHDYTFFGQFEHNTNYYGAVRYSF